MICRECEKELYASPEKLMEIERIEGSFFYCVDCMKKNPDPNAIEFLKKHPHTNWIQLGPALPKH